MKQAGRRPSKQGGADWLGAGRPGPQDWDIKT